MTDLSVIIPTCSPRVPLKRCLHSLVYQTLPANRYEILLINNGGEAHFESFIQSEIEPYADRVQLIHSEKNLGYAGGCRLGAEQAQGRMLVFHNDDAVSDPAFLALAWSEWRRLPDLGVATVRIVEMDRPTIQHEGVKQISPNGLFWQTGYGVPDKANPQHPQPLPFPQEVLDPENRFSHDIDFFTGCVWATPRTVWDEVGGVSTLYYPGYYEDTEYALRCRQLGYRIRLLRWVTCSHAGSLTLGGDSNRYWISFHRSRYLFMARNLTGYRWREIAAAEMRWWLRNRAGGRPGRCILGFLAALPRIPSALEDRREFKSKAFGLLNQNAGGTRPHLILD